MSTPVETARATRRRALVVDDVDNLASVVCKLLQKLGYEVDRVCDGEEALTMGREVAYDLVLCDILMPRMNGQTLFTTWQAENPVLAQKVIFMTGDGLGADTRGFVSRTGRPYLYKPFLMAQLMEVLAAAESA